MAKRGGTTLVFRGKRDCAAVMAALTAPEDKGRFNGTCNRSACSEKPADYYNPHTRAFYCRGCAQKINASLKATDSSPGLALCERHTLGERDE
jgi:hypothetical protein